MFPPWLEWWLPCHRFTDFKMGSVPMLFRVKNWFLYLLRRTLDKLFHDHWLIACLAKSDILLGFKWQGRRYFIDTSNEFAVAPSRTMNVNKWAPSCLKNSEPMGIDPVVVPEGNLLSIRFAGLYFRWYMNYKLETLVETEPGWKDLLNYRMPLMQDHPQVLVRVEAGAWKSLELCPSHT